MQSPGNLADLKTNCREFRWQRPCAPHKREGVTCPGCPHYDPAEDPPAHSIRPQRLDDVEEDDLRPHGVLIVKLAAAGDVLRTTALLPAIRERFSGVQVTWLTRPEAAGLFVGNDLVDEVLTTETPGVMARLASVRFEAVFCPDADQETAALAAGTRAKARYGFMMDERGAVVPLCDASEHWLRMGIWDHLKKANAETYQNLVARALELDPAAVGRPILEPAAADLAWATTFLARHRLTSPIVGINTGAGPRWRHKRWTRQHQAEFVTAMAREGIAVLLLGGSEEAQIHAELCRASTDAKSTDAKSTDAKSTDAKSTDAKNTDAKNTDAKNRDGKIVSAGTNLSYGRFAAILESCQVLVTGDTLALHLATARRVPVVALFGPTSAAEIELYGPGVKIQPEGLPCLTCYLPDCDVKPHCQELISADRVVLAVKTLLP